MTALGRILLGAGKTTARAGWGVGKTGYSLAEKGGTPGKIMLGGAIGGGYGFLSSEGTFTNRIESTLTGAMLGGTAGLASRAFAWNKALGKGIQGLKYRRGLERGMMPTAYDMGRAGAVPGAGKQASWLSQSPLGVAGRVGWGAGKMAGSAAFKAGRFAFEHPLATAGVIGGGYAAASLAAYGKQPLESPTLTGGNVNINYSAQAMAAYEMQTGTGAPGAGMVGSQPQMMRPMHRAMIGSTQGLTLGLHAGRHG